MVANVFRFNIVDASGAVSFVGPAHGLKVLAAACARTPTTISDLLAAAARYDTDWVGDIKRDLNVFDEHNVDSLAELFAEKVTSSEDVGHPAFRIIDLVTRQRSNQPARLGLVVINLSEQRIIQVQNSYAELARKGRGRVREEGKPTRELYHYSLPETWSIVP